MNELECFWHHVVEPLEGSFKDCFECGHVWRERGDFFQDAEATLGPMTIEQLEDLAFCPLCIHDF